ncbi:hypothetical protein KQI38_16730 [Tissierella carlieri]|uniref:hypothetical protein n=1 Tax=Tissierella carlieri TaxID=689904 RepID=UPI001C10C7C2|nr:hypothetical protein [Tissierella carlieri]MBU5313670.1 hypothetical protein [Tissierella carlieri]
MTGIILLEIMSVVSFIYSLLTIFFPFASISEIFIIFIWSITVSTIFAYTYRRSKTYQIIALLLLAPLIFYNNMESIYFVVIAAFLIHTYITKSFMKGSYSEYVDKLKKTYIVYGVTCILILTINEGYYNFINISIPFAIIYLMTTIILVRSIRHISTGMDMQKINQVNLRYIVMISVTSFIVTLDKLRNAIFLIIKGIYLFLIEIIMKILYYPITIMVTILNKVMEYIKGKMMENGNDVLEQLLGESTNESSRTLKKNAVRWGNTLVQKVIGILLIITTIYIIYKLIIKVGERSYKGLEYTEEREYIKEPRKKKKRFSREKYPRELNEQIRYYYRRYLEKLDKKKIQILKSDTSLDINEKAEEIFEDKIEGIRKIYIDSRYGNKDADKNIVEEMESLYKNL